MCFYQVEFRLEKKNGFNSITVDISFTLTEKRNVQSGFWENGGRGAERTLKKNKQKNCYLAVDD